MANQVTIKTNATTMAHHTMGETCFELPLRGDSLAAWSNLSVMRAFTLMAMLLQRRQAASSKHSQNLIPQRGRFAFAVHL